MADEHLIVELKASGHRAPFWLLHPLGGTLLFAARFVKHMRPEQPLLGIEARGLDGRAPPFRSLSDAARHYLTLILARQPEGPYLLGGPSFGGNLAYELAQLLSRRGAHVAMLALFDAHGPGFPRPVPLKQRLENHWHRLRSLDLSLLRPGLSPEAVHALARVPEGESDTLRNLRRVTEAHHQALRSYRPRPYAGHVHLFRANTAPDWPGMVFDDPTNGFGSVVQGGVHVVGVPGVHQLILDPPWVDDLAASFSRTLSAVQDACDASCVARESAAE